jgi:hypothetical protein
MLDPLAVRIADAQREPRPNHMKQRIKVHMAPDLHSNLRGGAHANSYGVANGIYFEIKRQGETQ